MCERLFISEKICTFLLHAVYNKRRKKSIPSLFFFLHNNECTCELSLRDFIKECATCMTSQTQLCQINLPSVHSVLFNTLVMFCELVHPTISPALKLTCPVLVSSRVSVSDWKRRQLEESQSRHDSFVSRFQLAYQSITIGTAQNGWCMKSLWCNYSGYQEPSS